MVREMIRHIELPDSKIPAPGKRGFLFVDGKGIALFNVSGTVYAIDDSCPHSGASLFGGKIEGRTVQCPAHGLKFNLATGCMPNGGSLAVRSHAIGLVNGKIAITLSDTDAADIACVEGITSKRQEPIEVAPANPGDIP